MNPSNLRPGRLRALLLVGALGLALAACGPAVPAQPAGPGSTPTAGAPDPAEGAATAYPAPQATAATAAYPDPGATAAPAAYPDPRATGVPPGYPEPQTTVDPAGAPPPDLTVVAVGPIQVATVPPSQPGVTGEAPAAVIAKMIADLVQRTGAEITRVTVLRAEAITWSDGSLGCPQPGVEYQQVLTDGYRVILAIDGKEYAYHTDGGDDFFLCERPRP